MAQGWLLYELTQSAVVLGYLGAATAIPAILMTMFGGAVADRFNKKYVLMTTSMLVAIMMMLLAFLDYTDVVLQWHVILIAAIVSFISGFDWPTRQSIFPKLIDREDMLSAVALNSIIWQSSRMVMPALGGILLAFTDTWLVFLFCAVGYVAMFLVVAGLKISLPGKKPDHSTLRQISEGLNYIFTERLFLTFISLSYLSMFFCMTHIQLMPALADLIGASEQGYGWLLSATGVGSIIGTLLIGSAQESKHLGRVIFSTAACAAFSLLLFMLIVQFANTIPIAYLLALIAVALTSMFSSMFMITSMTVMQLKVPDYLRGRVMGLHGITYSLMPLGGLFAGLLASVTSVPVAIAIGVVIYLCILAGISLGQKELVNLSGRSDI